MRHKNRCSAAGGRCAETPRGLRCVKASSIVEGTELWISGLLAAFKRGDIEQHLRADKGLELKQHKKKKKIPSRQ